MENDAKFEGWAVVELFGHQKEIGFVTTRYYGDKALFQIDVPELPAREQKTTSPRWIGSTLAPPDTVVGVEAVQGRTRLVSPGAIYALNPCTEEVARLQLERAGGREIKLVSLPPGAQLSAGEEEPAEDDVEDEIPLF